MGCVCLNPIITRSISRTGIVIQHYNIKKAEQCNFAFTSYGKILTQIRSYLRGLPHDETMFLSYVIDDITDICLPIGLY